MLISEFKSSPHGIWAVDVGERKKDHVEEALARKGSNGIGLQSIRGKWISNKILDDENNMLCTIKVNSNTIELTVHTSCYWVLDLLCVTYIQLVFGFYFWVLGHLRTLAIEEGL